MLSVKNIFVAVDDNNAQSKNILQNCSLLIKAGQFYVIMGPNGSGKSSFLYSLMGHPAYHITAGSIEFNGQNILSMPTHIRSKHGMYLSMQQPQLIAGLQNLIFLKEIYTIHQSKRVAISDFLKIIIPLLSQVGLDESILYRSLHDGFSGGEKKRFELLQMLLLQPKLCLLDEIDSGVDIDGLKRIALCLKSYKEQNTESAIVLVSHNHRILDYLTVDVVCIMMHGSIIKQGDQNLINLLGHEGYEQYAKRIE